MAGSRNGAHRAGAATAITPDKWRAVRAAVKATGDRFVELITAAPDAQAAVTADWSLADTAAHVTGIAWLYTALVQADAAPYPIPGLEQTILATTVDTVDVLNEMVLRRFTERDPREIASRLSGCIEEILASTDGLDPAAPIGWLGGSLVPRAGILAHLLNELSIHGRDIARAVKAPWHTSAGDAALFFELFLVEMIRRDSGRLMVPDESVRHRRIAVQFHSRHTAPVTLVLHHGREVTAEAPRRDDDVHVFFDPPAMNLFLFHRIGTPRAVLTGKVRVWGRRPWRLPTFLRTMHLP